MGNTCTEQPHQNQFRNDQEKNQNSVNFYQKKSHEKDRPNSHFAKAKNCEIPEATKKMIESIKSKEGEIKRIEVRGTQFDCQFITDKKAFYDGQWSKGKPNGKGKVYFNNGCYFEGGFIDGEAECNDSIFIYPDGSYYRGAIYNSQFNGQGEFYYKTNGVRYKGKWKNDKPQGKGQQFFPDGSKYEGNFQNGLKHGYGKFTWKDGRVYDGQWRQGYMHGNGTLKKNKGQFVGEFENGLKKSGTLKTQFGTYLGKFVNGEMQDTNGKFIWNDKKTYTGNFVNGQIHGNGAILYEQKNQKVQGLWEKGQNIKVEKVTNIK